MENFEDDIDHFAEAKSHLLAIKVAYYGGLITATIGIALALWLAFK